MHVHLSQSFLNESDQFLQAEVTRISEGFLKLILIPNTYNKLF